MNDKKLAETEKKSMKENEKGKKISKKIVSIVVLLAVLITTLVVVSMNKNTINLAKVGNVERKA